MLFLLTVPRRCFFCGSFLLFVCRVCRIFLSVHCNIVVTCWERTDLLALLCVMFYYVFVTFPCGVHEKSLEDKGQWKKLTMETGMQYCMEENL